MCLCVSMWSMCVCVCLCTSICVHVCLCVSIRVYACQCVSMCAYVCLYVSMCVFVCLRVCATLGGVPAMSRARAQDINTRLGDVASINRIKEEIHILQAVTVVLGGGHGWEHRSGGGGLGIGVDQLFGRTVRGAGDGRAGEDGLAARSLVALGRFGVLGGWSGDGAEGWSVGPSAVGRVGSGRVERSGGRAVRRSDGRTFSRADRGFDLVAPPCGAQRARSRARCWATTARWRALRRRMPAAAGKDIGIGGHGVSRARRVVVGCRSR